MKFISISISLFKKTKQKQNNLYCKFKHVIFEKQRFPASFRIRHLDIWIHFMQGPTHYNLTLRLTDIFLHLYCNSQHLLQTHSCVLLLRTARAATCGPFYQVTSIRQKIIYLLTSIFWHTLQLLNYTKIPADTCLSLWGI